MIQTLCKMKSKKGFTLMEMLIVVAIIAILAAIAIPVFSAQLTKARAQTDAANLRTAKSLAVSDYMLNSRSAATTYYFVNDNGGVAIGCAKEGTKTAEVYKNATGDNYEVGAVLKGVADSTKSIVITVTNGAVTTADSAAWVTAITAFPS